MNPNRSKIVKGHLVEEFCWAGCLVVYIDYVLSHKTYDEINEEDYGD